VENRTLLLFLVFTLFITGCSRQENNTSGKQPADCDINAGPCMRTLENGETGVLFDINPKPVTAMKDLVFQVTLNENHKAVADAEVILDLTMPGMFMGANRPVLVHTGEGRYEVSGIIPKCPHGKKLWKAEITIKRKNETAAITYLFEVD